MNEKIIAILQRVFKPSKTLFQDCQTLENFKRLKWKKLQSEPLCYNVSAVVKLVHDGNRNS